VIVVENVFCPNPMGVLLMSSAVLAIVLVVLAGLGAAAQPAFNGQLSHLLASPFRAAFVNFLSGVTLLGIVVAGSSVRSGVPSAETLAKVPPHLWVIGGALGAVFVTTAAWATPRIGAGAFFATLIAAQLIGAIALDHFGLIGLTVQPVSVVRIVGALMLIGGATLVVRG